MAAVFDDRDRQVVPRWRDFEDSLGRGELKPLDTSNNGIQDKTSVQTLYDEWNNKKSLPIACELVSAAYIQGFDEIAAQAAEQILESGSGKPSALSLAALYLKREPILIGSQRPDEADDPVQNDTSQHLARQFQLRILKTKHELVKFPRNALLWSNLSRLYATVDAGEKANQAITVALSLAPKNRFVIRGASRLLLHQGDLQKAHEILERSELLKVDPWVLSAEIATASARGKSSLHVKFAKHILDTNRFSSFHSSELASAIGTLDAKAGKAKAARKRIEYSLANPPENSVAQAAWLVRNQGLTVDINSTTSHEANAWSLMRGKQLQTALAETDLWLSDQPFSSRPAVFGSHFADVLGDYPRAIRFARQGLLSNANDFLLYNNLAFALLNAGKIAEGSQIIKRMTKWKRNTLETITLNATTGLLYFRSNNPTVGRMYYQNALMMANKSQLIIPETIARLYFALEEVRAGASGYNELRDRALGAADKLDIPWLDELKTRLRSASPLVII